MTPASAPRGRSASAGYLSIGQVLARLTPEFPDLSASKLRYFEEQGLVTPLRTEAGYRKFSPADVARVRTALTLQRDHDFKLARIREYLDAQASGVEVALPPSILEARRRYRRDELLATAGAPAALLDDAVSAGLVAAGETYDERALALLRALVALDSHGIQPRHVRGMRQAAEREVALVGSALAPLLRRTDAASRARAHELAPELLRRLDEVRAAFLTTALDRLAP
ncbi:MAG: MerR family transcriptional regulator [Microbacterium sp. SCN 70-200]|uniref:transcriptional regulator FtsR n=1 Tax=unclassified Microbacterium TaxID=2609290 RepID=UPI00086DA5B2|nr:MULTISPECIES: MerR family transcriptional regulator [unclassified Microbacterium]MBN9215969.1 MerR family transcriptional regulator [Microbacterium sp.]ODT41840.1 MAG: MerR family transcriptional regulator [Microbacterium sp. SCN 70-200]OJV84529.1 MAG: MerR family transcriptional regulator [Microbacterium sp. 70-16]